jgi:hypothetical protein
MRYRMIAFALLVSGSSWSQIEPKAGQWKTWVLASGREFRLAAPPDGNSTAGEIAWLHDLIAHRDDVANLIRTDASASICFSASITPGE